MNKNYVLIVLVLLVVGISLGWGIPKLFPETDPQPGALRASQTTRPESPRTSAPESPQTSVPESPRTTVTESLQANVPASVPANAPGYNSQIAKLVSEVSTSGIYDTTDALQSYSTRAYGTSGNELASRYLSDRLTALPDLIVEHQGGSFRNIIATLPGRDKTSDALYIVGAHYDSISRDEYAPGATDDGCGVGIVLELARVMSRHRFNHTVVFALWNPEEVDPMGTEDFVPQARRVSRNIALYYNFDSACYDPQNRFILDVQSDEKSATAAEMLTRDNSLYGINFTLTSNVFNCVSDYQVFRSYGYPAIATHSESHGPSGTSDDTIDKVSPVYARKNAQLGLAVLAGLAEIQD